MPHATPERRASRMHVHRGHLARPELADARARARVLMARGPWLSPHAEIFVFARARGELAGGGRQAIGGVQQGAQHYTDHDCSELLEQACVGRVVGLG